MNIIAEIGTSHGGNIEKAFSLIDAAKEAGADTVKFQWVYADEILHPDTGSVTLPGGKIPLYRRFQELEVKPDFFKKCMDYTRNSGMKFACSPFGIKSLEELAGLMPDYIKIASPELNHIPLLKKCASYIKEIPVIISSGVSKLSDIEEAISVLTDECPEEFQYGGKYFGNLTLLHCSTSYPTPEEDYNVRLVSTLKTVFGIPSGISDHSLDPVLIPVLSTVCGGTCIEKHITLSNETDGLDDPVALTPENFALMVHAVKQTETLIRRWQKEEFASLGGKLQTDSVPFMAVKAALSQLKEQFPEDKIEKALGDGIKRLSASESQNYGRTNRSLHYMKDLKKGHAIKDEDVSILRTEKILTPGIHPRFLETVKGKVLAKDVTSGSGVQLEDFFIS